MSRQCDARIQIATSRSLELDPEFAASMFYCVRDPLHEGPHWITMPSKSEPPAPPPCEVCGVYTGVRPTDRYPSHHALLAAKDAEVAELQARIKGMAVKYERQSKMNGSLSLVGAVRVAKELRAALAPKEGT